MSDDILDRLDDLIKQATTERSHYYVANTARQAAAEIRALRRDLEARQRLMERS
jgi:hypothetical protein